jgi:triosephosphate isomerase
MNNEDITQNVLTTRGYVFLMICNKLGEAGKEKLDSGLGLGSRLLSYGTGFYVLTASGTEEIKNYGSSLTFCNVDEITLKTMVRSNPGYMLLKEGIIMGKWSWANVPSFEELGKEYLNK